MSDVCAVHEYAHEAIEDHEDRIRILEKAREEDRTEFKVLIARITDLVVIMKWFIATTLTVCGIGVAVVGIVVK